jgi:hypothetical protein
VRRVVVASVCATALVVAGGGVSAPTAVATYSCDQTGSHFSVHLAGDKDSNFWLSIHRDVFAAIPREKAMFAVWSFGRQGSGPVLYGWAADGRSKVSPRRCRARSVLPTPAGALEPRLRVKSGWALGGRYECAQRGRVVIRVETTRRHVRVSVWMLRTRELIAVAEIAPGGGWIRPSKRCFERPR